MGIIKRGALSGCFCVIYERTAMPIFEYKCNNCNKVSEFLENAEDKTKRRCSYCGGSKLEKQFSTFAPKINPGESKKCNGCTDRACPHANM